MRRTAILLAVLLAGCSSSSHKSTTPTTTVTTTPTTTSTTVAPTTTSTVAKTTTTVGVTMTLVKFTGPPSPVACNAQTTMVEIDWEVRGAAKSQLSIDGALFAQFASGKHSGLEPLTCDGKDHLYTLKAFSARGSDTLTSSLTLKSKPPS